MKRALFAAGLVVFLGAFLEILSSLYYFFVVPEQTRAMFEPLVEVAGTAGAERHETLRFRPHPYFNYVFDGDYRYPDGFRPYNSRGFRAPEWRKKPSGTVRLVAVGGSTTYGIFSRDGGDVWPARLERALNAAGGPAVEVVNLGVTAYTSFEMLGVMAMAVPELEPDIVLINAGVNDAFAACYPDEGGEDNTRFRYAWKVRRIPGFAKAGMRKSYTLRVAGLLAMSLDDYLPGDMMNAMQYPPPGDEESGRNAASASGRYFRRNLQTVVVLTKNIGAVPVLFTQPLNPDWETVATPFYRASVGSQKRINEIIRDVGRDSGAAVIDLYAGMRERELFVDAVHANLRGEERQTRLIVPEVSAAVAAVRNRAATR
jgi:lysophospholipase L1-like esterase